MTDQKPPLLDGVRGELGQLGKGLREMARLRWQLAVLEFRAAATQVKRLAIAVGVAAVLGLTSLPVLVVYAAEMLNGLWLERTGWLLILGLGLLVIAIGGGWLAVWRFRRRFVGLEESLEELREDLVWLEEWLGNKG